MTRQRDAVERRRDAAVLAARWLLGVLDGDVPAIQATLEEVEAAQAGRPVVQELLVVIRDLIEQQGITDTARRMLHAALLNAALDDADAASEGDRRGAGW